ncbi:Photosystem I assembly protein Ycf3 [Candidatus Methanobinarius endosymbioticus]|uniref:Photosystem I assembly protein Ycf3 n=1 Tax=Candidatus Methanobinarius endosymbioticus TaxID=2006182 RepID=A0A366MD67_9EURY|nr:Photosystem I assembly protein Ycf3 [Candidatus Methanobinarius endosymbioticus]
MPIISFGSQDIDLITGKRTMTIRKLWKNPLKVGDRLHCYWNLISKEKKKIFEAEITDVQIISFKDLKNDDGIAKEEGYEDSKTMIREFKKMYVNDIDDDLFQIIRFKKLEIDEWEGEKIDEKSMITQRADILFDSGKYDKSAMCYTAALKFDPNDVYLLNKKGDNLTRLGKFEEAIDCYNKALEIEPTNEYIWNNKAIAFLNSGNLEKALESNSNAMDSNSKNPVVLYWRGFILEVLGKFEDALTVYDELLEIDNKNPEVWNARGNLLFEMENPEEALESYDKALELCFEDEIDSEAQNRKGNALLDLERFDEALDAYDKAIEIAKNNLKDPSYFILNKGVVLMELNNFQEAMETFTQVLAIDPKNDDAKVLRDECLENL